MSLSVKPTAPDARIHTNFPLSETDAYKPTGGRFFATFPVMSYITFAYKLTLAPDQRHALLARMPKWAETDRFEIDAHAAQTNPTKDQMRLMMQSLLAERFHLTSHFEARTESVFEMRLVKPGQLGPKIHPHDEGKPCDVAGPPVPPTDKNFLPPCDNYFRITNKGTRWGGSRNTTMETLAGAIPSLGDVSRTVVDRTGISGKYDWIMEWSPESTRPQASNADLATEPYRPHFSIQAQDQFGIKLETAKDPVQVLVVDHIEKPSEN